MFLQGERLNNETNLSEFLLLEFSNARGLQILHFTAFLTFYLTTVAGNLLIISAIASNHYLHTPMYFFLMNLAILDVGQVSVIFPKANSLLSCRYISYSGCVVQVLLFVFFANSDFFLLTIMAYDRYVAICYPLQYEKLLNKQSCIQMVSTVWVVSFFYGVVHTGGTSAAPFCSNVVNQFFCEIPQLLKLSCSDLNLFETGVLSLFGIIALACCIFIIVTYVHIFAAVLRIPSVQGRQKAFSTCLPHLIVFSLFSFTACFVYFKPTSNSGSHLDLAFTLIYTMVPPLMNPVIYSMWNKDIKHALSKLFGFCHSSNDAFSTVVPEM